MFRRMDWPHFAVLCTSLMSAGSAYASRDAQLYLGILSLPALLAGFAGAGLVLSFLPPRAISNGRLFGTIVFCALLGAVLSQIGVRVAAGYVAAIAGPGAEVAMAFVVGALAQVLMPWLIENKGYLLGRFLPTKKEGS